MANALTTGESTTVKCHSRLGRCDTPASLRPNICTYACSAAFSTTPYCSRTCGSACWPIAISWLSETRTICRFPVTGFRAQAVATAAEDATNIQRISFFISLAAVILVVMMPTVIILLLILVNGVFVMAEMALVSSRKPRLQQWANEGSSAALRALELSANPDRFLSTTQIGITLIGILTGASGQRALKARLSTHLDLIQSVAPYTETLAFVIVVVAITYLTLIFGELVPKRLALHNPERTASIMAN